MSTILQQMREATTVQRRQGSRLAAEALRSARGGPTWIASQMQRARSPMGHLVKSGHRLNDRAHRLVAQLLDRNLAVLETMLDAGTARLQTTAERMASYADALAPHRKARRAAAGGARRTRRAG